MLSLSTDEAMEVMVTKAVLVKLVATMVTALLDYDNGYGFVAGG